MVSAASFGASLDELRSVLATPWLDADLLELALTHRSYAYEHGGLPTNERLEFLGDAVLGLVVAEALYRRHRDLPEGDLAKLRAAVVNARALAHVARDVGLGSHLRLGKGERASGGQDKSSILADTLEALIGAVYLDAGFDGAATLVHRLFDPLLASVVDLGAGLDWKSSLQELAAERQLGVPEYLIDETGPDHAKSFTARVRLASGVYGNGGGRSKKEAEQQAAQSVWRSISEQRDAPPTAPARPQPDALPAQPD